MTRRRGRSGQVGDHHGLRAVEIVRAGFRRTGRARAPGAGGEIVRDFRHGANAGGRLVMGIIVLLLAFLGLVELLNLGLDGVAMLAEKMFHVHCNLRLENLLAYVFYPFALLIGVPPSDAWEVGRLLGMRLVLTEVPAYQELARLMATGGLHYGRSAVLASYALCGFAHVASVAIFVGGTAALAPNQTKNLAAVALRALLAATLACLMIAAIAGTFYGHGALVLTVK